MGKHLYKEGLRKCYICKVVKALDEYGKTTRNTTGHVYECKACIVRQLQALRERNGSISQRKKIIDHFGSKCSKCGIKNGNYSFFDIDHIKALRRGRGRRVYKLAEIANYMVLCPNCHRMKTISENGFV